MLIDKVCKFLLMLEVNFFLRHNIGPHFTQVSIILAHNSANSTGEYYNDDLYLFTNCSR